MKTAYLFDMVKDRLGDTAPAGRYTCRECGDAHGRLDVSLHLRDGQMYFECGGCADGWAGGCYYEWNEAEQKEVEA